MVYQFGPYEFDSVELELREGTIRKPLTPSLNRLLLLFVSRQGELVTREEIAEALWDSQESVDTVSGINTAVRRLRAQIGDNDGHGVFIETVIGAGYRFIAPVEVLQTAETITHTLVPIPGGSSGLHLRRIVALTVLVAIALAGIGWAVYSGLRNARHPETAATFTAKDFYPATSEEPEDKLTAAAVSTSGKYLASADAHGITFDDIATRETKLVELQKGFHVDHVAWFDDDSGVLVSGTGQPASGTEGSSATDNAQVWFISRMGEAHMLLVGAAMAAPSPDGLHLIYLRNGGTEIWRSGPKGDSAVKLVQTRNGETFGYLLWSPDSDRVVADRLPTHLENLAGADLPSNVGQDPGVYESYSAETGKLLAHRENVVFDSASLLHDGSLIYTTNRHGGASKIARVMTDISTGAFLTDAALMPVQSVFDNSMEKAEQVSASSDGNVISAILEGQVIDIYTANLSLTPTPALTEISRLSKRTFTNYPTSWSLDSKTVVFDETDIADSISISSRSLETGESLVYAQAKSQTDRFTQGRFSSDGRWLLYMDLNPKTGAVDSLLRVPAAGGQPQVVPTTGQVEAFRCSISPAGRCVVREIEGKDQFIYYELDPIRGMGKVLARVRWEPSIRGDWSVSPNGNTIAMAHHDPAHPTVELVDLTPASSGADSPIKEISVPGYGAVLSPAWAQAGHGMFLETFNSGKYDLLYMDLRGRITFLKDSPDLIWAVPSPDGKKIAMPLNTVNNRNVWLGTMRVASK